MKGYRKLLQPLPAEVQFESRPNGATNLVHVFETQRSRLSQTLAALHRLLSAEETIRELALPLGFVDIKVCAVTEVWSGLKLVVRKSLR